MRLVSFVIPVYNEEKGIERFCEKELFPELKNLEKSYSLELIFVNDGSPDRTLEKLNSLLKSPAAPKSTKLISFSRNFGKEAALTAGFRLAKGDCAISLDSDGQQPPSLIPKFLEKWESGAKIVTGVRDGYTKHGLIPRLGSKLFYKLLKIMGNNSTVPGSTDFRLLDRAALDEFNALSEHNRITRGLIDWLGYRQEYIKYLYGTRIAGRPSYNLKKLFHLAIDSFVSMSSTPLVIFGYVGIIFTVLSFLLGVFCLINQYLLGDPLGLYWPGAVHMAILITFLIGLVLISQAITAVYISNIYTEAKNRPLYIIDKENSKLK